MAKSVGLDPGEYEVKVVELDGSYRRPRLAKLNIERIAQESASAADERHAANEAESLRHVLKDAAISKEGVTLGFPCREAVLRILNIPFTGTDKIRKVIKFEAEGEIHSHQVDDMVVDFHTISEAAGETRVLVAAVPKQSLRTTLEALERTGIEPECVDLDTMALFRLAEWAGAFEQNGEEAEGQDLVLGENPGTRLVIDLGARSTRVLIVVDGHLTDMRALRHGADAIAQEIATGKDLDLETARNAVQHCLVTGGDYELGSDEQGLLEDEIIIDDENIGEDEESREVSESTDVAPPTLITHQSVVVARDRYLQKLRRELMRFLTSVSKAGQIERVWITGGGSRVAGVEEVLEEVFGCSTEPLQFMDMLSHDLDDEEALDLEPRLAAAVGLALGQMGGAAGFNFRQEDLIFRRRFDRIKLPLAIACMLFLFFLCFQGLKLRKELTNLERTYGVAFQPKKTADARRTGRKGNPTKGLPLFTGYVGKLISPHSWAGSYLGDDYPKLVRALEKQPVFKRLTYYRTYLQAMNRDLEAGAGQVTGYELDSGDAVLQEFAEIVERHKDALGRLLVAGIELSIPHQDTGRYLIVRVAFRGNDFRTRMANLKAGFQEAMSDPKSAFLSMDEGREELFRNGEGCYYELKVDIKPKVPVRHKGLGGE